LDAESYGSEIG